MNSIQTMRKVLALSVVNGESEHDALLVRCATSMMHDELQRLHSNGHLSGLHSVKHVDHCKAVIGVSAMAEEALSQHNHIRVMALMGALTMTSLCSSNTNYVAKLTQKLAKLMRERLTEARAKGRHGWWNNDVCSVSQLRVLRSRSVLQGDVISVLNFSAMLALRESYDSTTPSDTLDYKQVA